jgi:diguanylate cyclase (GGDEF)-like protein
MQQFEAATTAHAVLTREGKIVAADAILRSWLGERTIAELLPELGQLTSQHTSPINLLRVDQPPTAAILTLTEIEGELGALLLLRIELAPQEAALYHDAVTGLPDRRALESQRERWQSEAKTETISHAVLFMDLDNFKQINDQHGHATGDKVLRVLAERWQQALRHGDLIVRYGGDEFVALLRGINSAPAAKPIVERLQKITEQPLEMDGQSLHVQVTIGLALASNGSVSLEHLVAEADRAMYAAKRNQ